MVEDSYWNDCVKMFESVKYKATEEEIKAIVRRMNKLKKRGLSKLNKRLIDSGRGLWDTFAEHNFGYNLIRKHPDIPVLYEPDECDGKALKRPIDFVVQKEGITFWMQMKKLSNTERENRRSKNVAKIKKLIKQIKVSKFCSCSFSESFSSDDVSPLVKFISEIAASSRENEIYYFPSREYVKAEIVFHNPNKAKLEHLTLAVAADMDFINVTGESREHITGSLSNAAGAFRCGSDSKNINLIVMEVGGLGHDYIDLDEALFGNEIVISSANQKEEWGRRDNGFFDDPDLGNQVAGVIALRRKEHAPLSSYTKTLFINDNFKNMIDGIKLVIDFDRIIPCDELICDSD